jgi:hypothetical protein
MFPQGPFKQQRASLFLKTNNQIQNEPFLINQIPTEDDFLLHVDNANCKGYNNASKESGESEEYKFVSEYFKTNYMQQLSELVDMPNINTKTMNDICGYI